MERVKIALVGLNFGRHIAAELLNSKPASELFELAALCDADPKRLAAECSKLSLPGYAGIEELFAARPDIQTIGLYTGPNGRAQLLRKLFAAGRDVMTTKPFELDPEAARAILAEARAAGRTVHLNSPSPEPAPDIAAMLSLREKFSMGQLVSARFETYSRYDEKTDGSWYDSQELCPLAPVFRIGVYGINDILYFDSDPELVQTLGARIFTGRPTPDNAQLSLRFRSGAIASVFASLATNPGAAYPNRLELLFEKGQLCRAAGVSASEEPERVLVEASAFGSGGKPHVERLAIPRSSASGSYRWASFAAALRERRPLPEKAAAHVVDGIRVLAAMKRSHLNGGSAEPVL
jgi:predicted dehydrogenase